MSLRLLRIEWVLTGTFLAMPIMVPFYYSIGMDQGQVGLSQAAFTAVILLANIPTGWLADKFSRKFCNAFGDLGCAGALIVYSNADSFLHVVLAEVLFGLALAFSRGADRALLSAYTQPNDKFGDEDERKTAHGNIIQKETAQLTIWQTMAQVVALAAGGMIGANDPRLAILITAVPFAIGGVLSLFMKEAGERLVSKHRNPFRDMAHFTGKTFTSSPGLRWSIMTLAVGRNSIEVLGWVFTPLLLLAGVPLWVVGIAWVADAVMVMVGAWLAKKYANLFADWQRFMLPMAAVFVGLSIMSIHLSIGTIWFYGLIGLAKGWVAATVMPIIQKRAPANMQATVTSTAMSVTQLMYIPAVSIVSHFGNNDIRMSMVATLAIFAPLAAMTTWKLVALERK